MGIRVFIVNLLSNTAQKRTEVPKIICDSTKKEIEEPLPQNISSSSEMVLGISL